MSVPPAAGPLTLAQCTAIIAAAFDQARTLGLKPLTVAVLDAGGHLIALQRQDGSSQLRPQIALAKASGALALGVSSRRIGVMAEDRPTFVAALASLAPHGVLPAAGGVLISDGGPAPIGAVGITGDTSDHDEQCAQHGIAAAGFVALA